MNTITKGKVIFFLIGLISLTTFFVLTVIKTNRNLKNFRENFDLKFKGVISEIKYHDHGGAYIKVKVIESNKTEFKDSKYLGFDYCNLKNGIATMDPPEGWALEIGDSVFVGPSDYFVAKYKNDTIVGGNQWNDLVYKRHNIHREY